MADLDSSSTAPLQSKATEPNPMNRTQALQDMEEGEGGIQAAGAQGDPTTTSGLFKAVGACFLLFSPLLMIIPALLGDRLCLESDGVRHCQHELKLGLPEPSQGPPGEQCKVLVTLHGQDQPCCYKDQAFGLNYEVCFEQENVLVNNNICRNRSRYPEVKMLANNCELTLKALNEDDVGCYYFFMPHNSKEPLYHKCVALGDICPFTKTGFCLLKPLVQCLWCAIILVADVLACKKIVFKQ